MTNFIEELFSSYSKNFYQYYHVKDASSLELIAFTHGILYILIALKINPEKVNLNDNTLKDNIDEILEKFKSSKLKVSDSEEEIVNDFVHDKDDVGFRKYIPGGEG